jgi:hypothetical protein
MLQALWRGVRGLLGGLAALLILFEEWGWEPLQRALTVIARLPPLAWLERRIAALPPWGAVAVFAVPSLLLVPLKLAALWLIAHGQALAGVLLIVGAKLAGTAIVARLFTLTRPALLRLAWFATLHGRWVAWKEALLQRVRASWPWRAARIIKQRVRRRWLRWRQAS